MFCPLTRLFLTPLINICLPLNHDEEYPSQHVPCSEPFHFYHLIYPGHSDNCAVSHHFLQEPFEQRIRSNTWGLARMSTLSHRSVPHNYKCSYTALYFAHPPLIQHLEEPFLGISSSSGLFTLSQILQLLIPILLQEHFPSQTLLSFQLIYGLDIQKRAQDRSYRQAVAYEMHVTFEASLTSGDFPQ